jgi:hypothetical protein
MRLRFQPAGLLLVALLLLLAVPARAQERIEGTVASTKLTRCEMKPGTCEGSLVLETREAGKPAQVTIEVRKGTAIKKGTDHLFLPALKGQPVVISFVTEKGERVARSIEVRTGKP